MTAMTADIIYNLKVPLKGLDRLAFYDQHFGHV